MQSKHAACPAKGSRVDLGCFKTLGPRFPRTWTACGPGVHLPSPSWECLIILRTLFAKSYSHLRSAYSASFLCWKLKHAYLFPLLISRTRNS